MSVSKVNGDSKKPEIRQGVRPQPILPAQKTLTENGNPSLIVIPSLRGRTSPQYPKITEKKPEKPTPPAIDTSLPSILPSAPIEGQAMLAISLCKGQVKFTDGSIDKGEFLNHVLHGVGYRIYPNKDKYTGDFFNGLPHGVGIYNFINGDIYKGDISNGSFHGLGTLTYATGRVYSGQFKNGSFDGQGTLTYNNGDNYVGEFKNDRFDGQGKLSFADGRPAKEGTFSNGKKLIKKDSH